MKVLVYGSYGYSAKLILENALSKGTRIEFVLSGRNEELLAEQQFQYSKTFQRSLETRQFRIPATNDSVVEEDWLRDIDVVMNCAGPFIETAEFVVKACIKSKVHYLDITGEIPVFELLHDRYDELAKAANIMILPGTGFDIVPTDCLAMHLKQKCPDATNLLIAFGSEKSLSVSRGTALTGIHSLGQTTCPIRKDGKITGIPFGKTKSIPLIRQDKAETCLAIPWGDVCTAYYSTGIPNIEAYVKIDQPYLTRALLIILSYLSPFIIPWLKPLLAWLISHVVKGPSEEHRKSTIVTVWGCAWNETKSGSEKVTARISVPEGYETTQAASNLIIEKIAQGKWKPGFQTPSLVYGPSLILEISHNHFVDKNKK